MSIYNFNPEGKSALVTVSHPIFMVFVIPRCLPHNVKEGGGGCIWGLLETGSGKTAKTFFENRKTTMKSAQNRKTAEHNDEN